jgi:hypothetical protein
VKPSGSSGNRLQSSECKHISWLTHGFIYLGDKLISCAKRDIQPSPSPISDRFLQQERVRTWTLNWFISGNRHLHFDVVENCHVELFTSFPVLKPIDGIKLIRISSTSLLWPWQIG